MPESQNLWGDIENIEAVSTPIGVLREQARILSEKTGYVLRGDVVQDSSADGTFRADLVLEVESLNYRHLVVSVRYPITLYPLIFHDFVNSAKRECQTHGDFIDALGSALSSSGMRRVITVLVSQARS